MIKLIKLIIFYAIEFIFYSYKFTRYTYKLIINVLTVQLKTLPLKEVFKFLIELISSKLTDNSIIRRVTVPLGLNWKNLCDTKLKKLFILIITFIVLIYRWFITLKKILLWSFKLGII